MLSADVACLVFSSEMKAGYEPRITSYKKEQWKRNWKKENNRNETGTETKDAEVKVSKQ